MGSVKKLWRKYAERVGFGGFLSESSEDPTQGVDKLWENLWVSLWERCGKVLWRVWESSFSTYFSVILEVFHGMVEKFYKWIYTWMDRGRGRFCTVSTALTITTIKNII